MEIDIIIDELTNCIRDRITNIEYNTEYRKIFKLDKATATLLIKQGWKFDWNIPFHDGYEIYALSIKGSKMTQGLIALKKMDGYIHIGLVESHPSNIGHRGKYIGVGGNLFAIACKVSFDCGFDGYVQFLSKTNLIKHYVKLLKAKIIADQLLIIETNEAQTLIRKYLEDKANE